MSGTMISEVRHSLPDDQLDLGTGMGSDQSSLVSGGELPGRFLHLHMHSRDN